MQQGIGLCTKTSTYSGIPYKKGNQYLFHIEIHKETLLPLYYFDTGSIMNQAAFQRIFNDLQTVRNAKIKEILDI